MKKKKDQVHTPEPPQIAKPASPKEREKKKAPHPGSENAPDKN